MALRVGEMMVVVRAQDFASRTLHRVSGELAGMSRAQRLAMQGQRAAFQLSQAQGRMEMARLNARRLAFVKNSLAVRKALDSEIATLERLRAAQAASQARVVDPTTQRVRKGINPALFKQWQGLNAALKTMEDRIGTTTTRMTRMEQVVSRLPSWMGRAARSTIAMGDAQRRVANDLAVAENSLTDAQRAWLAHQRAMANLPINRARDYAHALSGIGRTMQLTGALLAGGLGIAANAFAGFSEKVTLAATQTRKIGESAGATARNADRLTKVIENFMTQFPANAQQMADAAYTIFSSIDVGFTNGTRLLKMFNMAAVAGGTDLETATNASITVLENFDRRLAEHGQITKTTTDLMNRMFAIVRFGRLNFLQLSQMLGSVVPAATGARQSFDDVAGALAYLTRTLGTKAGASLSRLLEVFTNRDIRNGMRKTGLAIEDATGKLLPFPEIIRRMASVAKDKGTDLNDFFRIISGFGRGAGRGREFTVQARRAFIQLVKNYREYMNVQGQVVGDNDEFRKSFEAMAQTMGVRWRVFLNQLKVLVLTIGEQAIPVFLKIGDTISKWVEKWRGLSEGTRKNIVQWGVWIGVGTLLAGVFASIVGSLDLHTWYLCSLAA